MSLEAPPHAVDELLAAVAEAFGDDPDRGRLDELGDRADEIVSTTDLSELVAAIGLGEDDDRPQSLPAAVAAGEPQAVAALRSLLTAAKLPPADEEQKDQLIDELRSLVETAQTEPPDERESTDTAESESTETAESESTDDLSDGSDEAESDEEKSSIRQLLESQLQETFDIFDDGPEGGLELESLTDGLTDGDDGDTDEAGADSTESSDEPSDEPSNDADDDTDTEQSDQSRDGTRWHPGGRGRTTHSTISTAGRRDIGRSGQFSTIRGSTVSKR